MSTEKRNCKVCLQDKFCRHFKPGTNNTKIYADEKDRLWKGYVCPDCQAKKRRDDRANKNVIAPNSLKVESSDPETN